MKSIGAPLTLWRQSSAIARTRLEPALPGADLLLPVSELHLLSTSSAIISDCNMELDNDYSRHRQHRRHRIAGPPKARRAGRTNPPLVREDPSKSKVPAGLEPVGGDMADVASMRSVLKGVDTLFLLNAAR